VSIRTGYGPKSGYRRLYVSDELDRFYGEYVWRLCEAGADLVADDFGSAYVFVNLDREPRFAPWRPESVYDLVERLRRQLSWQVPQAWTPHWMRHSHATALLLSGYRFMWSVAGWATATCRPRSAPTRT
jgi:site-specific recombinase XerD